MRRPAFYAAVVVLAVLAGGAELTRRALSAPTDANTGGTAIARHEDLVITVTEGGTLRAKDSVEIICQVEGNATVTYLIAEGTTVEKGDKLVELDSADLKDRKVQEDSTLNSFQSDYRAAEENLAIQESLRESDMQKAKLALQFAETDLKKFLEGDRPQQRQKAETDITIAQEELTRAQVRLGWTEKLEKEKIVTREELDADKLAVHKTQITLDQAKETQRLLEKYEFPKQEAKLQSDRDLAKLELERTDRRTASQVAQFTASRDAKKTNFEIQRQKVKKIDDQIAACVITAPQAGLVVYAVPRDRWSNQRPPELGGQVHNRQTLMNLPDLSQMELDVKIHESQIDRIETGMKANISMDAFPGRTFTGTVHKVAVMADTGDWWSSGVKSYTIVLSMDQAAAGLKPGMSAEVEIVSKVLKNQLVVPVNGVHTLRGRTAALVKNSDAVEVREIKVGPNNDRMAVIEAGLADGDEVLLYEPKGLPEIPWNEDKKPATAQSAERPAGPIIPPMQINGGPNGGPEAGPGKNGGARPAGRRRPDGASPDGSRDPSRRPRGERTDSSAAPASSAVAPPSSGAAAGTAVARPEDAK